MLYLDMGAKAHKIHRRKVAVCTLRKTINITRSLVLRVAS